jgi:hypothetical protein
MAGLKHMRTGGKRILAVMVVTAALCADHAVAAAPTTRQEPAEIGNIAHRLVGRLAKNFRQVIPATRSWAIRRPGLAVSTPPAVMCEADPSAARPQITPFQFRLPPPAV